MALVPTIPHLQASWQEVPGDTGREDESLEATGNSTGEWMVGAWMTYSLGSFSTCRATDPAS